MRFTAMVFYICNISPSLGFRVADPAIALPKTHKAVVILCVTFYTEDLFGEYFFK